MKSKLEKDQKKIRNKGGFRAKSKGGARSGANIGASRIKP